jgi:hypothetical protein
MYKDIFLLTTFCAFLLPPIITTQPASAMTADEFLRMLGVIGRYADDINRTFPSNPQPNIIPPNAPNSQPYNPQPTQPESIPMIPNQTLEQFFPRQ